MRGGDQRKFVWQQIIDLPASGDRRHNGNVITVLHRSGVFLQVADILVIEVNVDKSAQFAVVGIEMAAQFRMLGDQVRERIADGPAGHLDRSLFARILPQRGWNMDLGHRPYMMPQTPRRMQPRIAGVARAPLSTGFDGDFDSASLSIFIGDPATTKSRANSKAAGEGARATLNYFHFLPHQLLIVLVESRQLKGVRDLRRPFRHLGDYIGAAEPVCLGQIGG